MLNHIQPLPRLPIGLIKDFPKSLDRVVYTQQSTTQVQKGALNGVDVITGINILTINSLSQGGTPYTEGTDFSIIDGTISWALGGSEPAPGAQYDLDYTYRRTLTVTGVKLGSSGNRVGRFSG